MKFIHAADLHLDSPMSGLSHLPGEIFERLQESTFQALKTLIDHALHFQVDFVILAGDLFDLDDRSIRAQIRLRKEMERLAESGIPCYIVFGNHDHLGGNWTHIEMPENVQIFGKEVEVKELLTKEGTAVHLYGFSYPVRHVFERKIADYKKKGEADFHIGILHGNLEGSLEHGNYAPFTLQELLDKDFDYWALGHIHKRTLLCKQPPVVYPGNTQGRNRKEEDEKGCYLVTLTESGAELKFFETSDVIWRDITIDGTGAQSFDDLLRLCLTALNKERREGKGILARLTFNNAAPGFNDLSSAELLEILQDDEKEESSFVWPYSVKFAHPPLWNKEDLAGKSDFYSELFAIADENTGIEESLAFLYEHPNVRRFLRSLHAEEIEEVKEEAVQYLIGQLLSWNEGAGL